MIARSIELETQPAAERIRLMWFRCRAEGQQPAEFAVSMPAGGRAGLGTMFRVHGSPAEDGRRRFSPARLIRMPRGAAPTTAA